MAVNRFDWHAPVTDPDHLVPDGVLGTLDGGGLGVPGSASSMSKQQILDLQLFRAIQADNKQRVEALLGVGANVNFVCTRSHGTLAPPVQLCTPLLPAVYEQRRDDLGVALLAGDEQRRHAGAVRHRFVHVGAAREYRRHVGRAPAPRRVDQRSVAEVHRGHRAQLALPPEEE